MIVEIPDDNSIVKWKMNDDDEWKTAEISDLIKAYMGRPQGKWEFYEDDPNDDDMAYYKCSMCGRLIRAKEVKLLKNYPFCHCGADMRGGVE